MKRSDPRNALQLRTSYTGRAIQMQDEGNEKRTIQAVGQRTVGTVGASISFDTGMSVPGADLIWQQVVYFAM